MQICVGIRLHPSLPSPPILHRPRRVRRLEWAEAVCLLWRRRALGGVVCVLGALCVRCVLLGVRRYSGPDRWIYRSRNAAVSSEIWRPGSIARNRRKSQGGVGACARKLVLAKIDHSIGVDSCEQWFFAFLSFRPLTPRSPHEWECNHTAD